MNCEEQRDCRSGQNLNEKKKKYITNRVEDQITWYDKKSIESQKWYKFHRKFQIISTACIPLIASTTTLSLLESIHTEYIVLIISILAAASSISSALNSLQNYHEHWIEYRKICEQLKHELYSFENNSSKYCNEETDIKNFQIFVQNVEYVLSAENKKWETIKVRNKK